MTTARTCRQVVAAVKAQGYELGFYRHEPGYFVWVYDTLDKGGIYEEQSDYTFRLNQRSLEAWVADGVKFATACQTVEKNRKQLQESF